MKSLELAVKRGNSNLIEMIRNNTVGDSVTSGGPSPGISDENERDPGGLWLNGIGNNFPRVKNKDPILSVDESQIKIPSPLEGYEEVTYYYF